MEFGSLNNLIYFFVPLFLVLIMIIGFRKRVNILKNLNLRSNRFISISKIVLMTLGAIFVVIALLSPQKQLKDQEISVKGVNIYALIDTSRSMLTEDVYPNRLEMSKKILEHLIEKLKGDKIGFIPFSDSAYIQMPLTDDYAITKNYINALDSNLISGGGTQLYQALELAEKSFEKIDSKNKTVLIISDGGDFDKKSLDYIKKNKITVFSVGVGTQNGSIIPEYIKGRKVGFIKDKNGAAVISKLNSDFLKQIAQEGNGKYYEVNNLQDTTKNFAKDLLTLDRTGKRNERITTYTRYFQFPLAIGILLILIGYLLREVVKDEK